MHRKSAYILFLAVLGLLAIGIVILSAPALSPKTATTMSTISFAGTPYGSESVSSPARSRR